MNLLTNFTGDIGWIHDQEGHAGSPYWPGGQSGLTLDPGFDLGYQSRGSLRAFYSDVLSEAEISALDLAIGVTEVSEIKALLVSTNISAIRISYEEAKSVFPYIAYSYWVKLLSRFTGLRSAPGAVQTAVLSLGINRGPSNRGLEPLSRPIEKGSWLQVAEMIGEMQQDHELAGIRARRKREAKLITDYLQQSITVSNDNLFVYHGDEVSEFELEEGDDVVVRYSRRNGKVFVKVEREVS